MHIFDFFLSVQDRIIQFADTLLQLQPFGAVRLEPCAFVVSVQLPQEFDDRLHATRRKADIATSVR